MKARFYLFFILIISGICSFVTSNNINAKNSPTDSLIILIDEVIANRDDYTRSKESKIESLRTKVNNLSDPTAKFHALGDLMDEYLQFNTDSAYNILLQREKIATETGDSTLILNTLMNKASLLFSTAMYLESKVVIDSINPSKLPDYLMPYYFHIKRTLYGKLADFSSFPDERQNYRNLEKSYKDSLLSLSDKSSLLYYITLADKYNSEQNPQMAIDTVNEYIRNNELSEHERAIFSWTLAKSYKLLGDDEKYKSALMSSALADLRSGVREYISLRVLAELLYQEDDIDRAFRYISVAMEDAALCNARHRIIELNNLFPVINGIYIEKKNEEKRALGWTIGIISVLSIGLLFMFIFSRKQMTLINQSKKEIQKTNQELDELNNELKTTNQSLIEANNDITELSHQKETYITEYMEQCQHYIEKLNSFKNTVASLINLGKTEELKKIIKTYSGSNDELKEFYGRFDKTFLSLFPSFIDDVNTLLQPDEALIPKKNDTLTPELRILALIRLGITDSESIAKFLNYSLTTIYNYRTKLRNKFIGDRNDFENEIMKIGTSD